MRGDQYLFQAQEGVLGVRRLLFEDIQSRARDLALSDCPRQCLFIHNPTAGAIHNAQPRFAAGELCGPDQVPGLTAQWNVQGEEIHLRKQLFKGIDLTSQSGQRILGQVWIVTEDLHPKGTGSTGHFPTHFPQPHHSKLFSVQLDPQKTRPFPLPGPHGGIGTGDPAGQRQHQGHSVLGGSNGILPRSVHHDHPSPGGSGNIYVVHAGSRPAHHPQPRGAGEELLRHLGVGTNH